MLDQQFQLNPSPLAKKAIIANTKPFIFLIVFIIAIIYFGVFKEKNLYALLTIPILAIPILLIFFAKTIKAFKNKKNTPNLIIVRDDSLTLGDHTLTYAEIDKILLTPPTYYTDTPYRTIRIYTNNKTYFHILGLPSRQRDIVFPEYEEFAETLAKRLNSSPGKFQYDL